MRHQRLRIVATIEFPPGFNDDEAVVLGSCKNAVRETLRAWHDEQFGNRHWPLEVNVLTRWNIENEMEAVV